jgi:hypothetical protein
MDAAPGVELALVQIRVATRSRDPEDRQRALVQAREKAGFLGFSRPAIG